MTPIPWDLRCPSPSEALLRLVGRALHGAAAKVPELPPGEGNLVVELQAPDVAVLRYAFPKQGFRKQGVFGIVEMSLPWAYAKTCAHRDR